MKKFFDSIDQDILIKLIQTKIKDEDTIWLIDKIIKSFSEGLPLGNVTSQLFANIYLNELDQFIKHTLKEKYYIRYCDDFVILSKDQNHLSELAIRVNKFLIDKLKLFLHPNKIITRKYRQGVDFLGYVVLPNHRVLRTRTKRRLLRKIGPNSANSYLGILDHCSGYNIEKIVLAKLGL
ncbi:MAG: RNA-directed DNA polymerase [Patescibacteria group bacterium]